MKDNGQRIEFLISEEKWPEARRLIEKELKVSPDDHWLLDRLSVTYYEEKNYHAALDEIKKAYHLAPNCPLVLWDYAGASDAIGHHSKAKSLYVRILNKFPDGYGDTCTEDKLWMNSLAVDCFFRLAICCVKLDEKQNAVRFFDAYIRLRKSHPELQSLYEIKDASRRKKQLAKSDQEVNEVDDIACDVKQVARGTLSACS
jgi:tetratricopeptide (TPR) repeat protein